MAMTVGIRGIITITKSSLGRRMTSSYPLDVTAKVSGLHKLADIPENPFLLFQKWYGEQKTENHISSNAVCLSTSTKDGRVSSRNVILRRLDQDGFLIITDKRSKKCKEIQENPYAAMTFLWVKENSGVILSRQVRAEGEIKELPFKEWEDIYSLEPLFCKIRAYVCHQGKKVDWNSLKDHHDKLFQEFTEGKNDLAKPEHVSGYKLLPQMMEFYESEGPKIADRVMFLKDNNMGWKASRIAA